MKNLILLLALVAGQANTLQDRPVVRLQPHRDTIGTDFGGKLLKLDHAPALLRLPPKAPKLDDDGNPWSVEIKNFGPGPVTVADQSKFKVEITVGQTVFIYSSGAGYSLKPGGTF